MIRKTALTFLFFVFLFYPQKASRMFSLASFLPSEKLHSVLSGRTFITLSGRNVVTLPGSRFRIPFSNYIDWSEEGYFVTYDKMGNQISLYYHEKKLQEWENQYNYPRISYPYLFLFSSDLTKVRVFDMTKTLNKPVLVFSAPDMITSWASSKLGNYFILGDLIGKYYIYDNQKGRMETRCLQKSRINYVKGVSINSQGDYLVLGSLYPEILESGNLHHKRTEQIELPGIAKSRRKIWNFSRYAFFPKDRGVLVYDKLENSFSMTDSISPFYTGMEGERDGCFFLVFAFKSADMLRLDFYERKYYHYSVFVQTESLPVLVKGKKNYLILWDGGTIRL